jgi:TorA maturation chaperone TorD
VHNPAGAPPYADFYLGGAAATGSRGQAPRQAHGAAGIASGADFYRRDHLAVQSECLHLLARRGLSEEGGIVLARLLAWLPEFQRRIEMCATTPLYPAMGRWFLELAIRERRATAAAPTVRLSPRTRTLTACRQPSGTPVDAGLVHAAG